MLCFHCCCIFQHYPPSVIRLVQVLPWDRYCSPPNPPPPCESCNPSSCLLAACNHKLLYIQCPSLSNRPYNTISCKNHNPICTWWIIIKNVPKTLMAKWIPQNEGNAHYDIEKNIQASPPFGQCPNTQGHFQNGQFRNMGELLWQIWLSLGNMCFLH